MLHDRARLKQPDPEAGLSEKDMLALPESLGSSGFLVHSLFSWCLDRGCLSGSTCGPVISKNEGRVSFLEQSCQGQRQCCLGDLLRLMLPFWAGASSSPSQWKLLLLCCCCCCFLCSVPAYRKLCYHGLPSPSWWVGESLIT